MVQLIYNPQPANWPGHVNEMPPMPIESTEYPIIDLIDFWSFFL